MDNKSKIRLTISAVTCSLLLGGSSIALKNLHSDNFTFPFYRDSLKTYGVSSQEFTIDKLGKDKVEVSESDIEKKYLLLSEMENKDSVTVNINSPLVMEEREKLFSTVTEDVFVSHCYSCSFYYGNLTDEEIDEKVSLFKEGNLKELIQGCNYSITYKNTIDSSSDEKIDKDNFSASLKVNTIDLEDIKFKKQTIDENIIETLLFSFSTFLGTYAGVSIGNAINKRVKRKVKTNQNQK